MDSEYRGRRIVVMGLGRFGGGIGVSRWLAGQEAHVLVTDRADRSDLADSIDRLGGLGIECRCGGHDPADLDGADLLVVSPAVDKAASDFVAEARRRNIPLTSEMNLFLERCPAPIVGVTGTAGKSTTCAMLEGILRTAAIDGELSGRNVWFGGNIGRSLLGDLQEITEGDWVLLELSSFQLEDVAAIGISPSLAVFTDVFPHHLDRHRTFSRYLGCKLNLCRFQSPGSAVIVGDSDKLLGKVLGELTGRTGAILIGAGDPADLTLRVPGAHQRRNAALAWRAASHLGVSDATARRALADFRGLPHRLEWVTTMDQVDYYSDSKATTPEGVVTALRSFDRPVILIVGGQEKHPSWEPVIRNARGRVKGVLCVGENRVRLAGVLEGTAFETLSEAVAAARRLAAPGDVVLFSPGCPSYDQFVNYEARGRAFKSLLGAGES